MMRPTLLPPALLALASLAGLILALVGDGLWDWIGLACLLPGLLLLLRTLGRAFGAGQGAEDRPS